MPISSLFGIVAAIGWLISSGLWVLSTRVKLVASLPVLDPIKYRGTHNNPVGQPFGTWIDGMPQLLPQDVQEYLAKSGRYNSQAGIVSAGAAFLSAVAIVLQTLSI